jgi:hypothetical protein
MKNAVIALTEAVRLARLEIVWYRDSDCRSTPEGTINRLAQLLGEKSVDDAMAVLAPDAESPSIIPNQEERARVRSKRD